MTDPGFPRGRGAKSPGGADIRFCQIFPKTAWNWKNLDPQGGASVAPPLDTPLPMVLEILQPPLVALTNRFFFLFYRQHGTDSGRCGPSECDHYRCGCYCRSIVQQVSVSAHSSRLFMINKFVRFDRKKIVKFWKYQNLSKSYWR